MGDTSDKEGKPFVPNRGKTKGIRSNISPLNAWEFKNNKQMESLESHNYLRRQILSKVEVT